MCVVCVVCCVWLHAWSGERGCRCRTMVVKVDPFRFFRFFYLSELRVRVRVRVHTMQDHRITGSVQSSELVRNKLNLGKLVCMYVWA